MGATPQFRQAVAVNRPRSIHSDGIRTVRACAAPGCEPIVGDPETSERRLIQTKMPATSRNAIWRECVPFPAMWIASQQTVSEKRTQYVRRRPLILAQSDHWINTGCETGGKKCSQQRRKHHDRSDQHENGRIRGTQSVELILEHAI